jgi:hypothetical protein
MQSIRGFGYDVRSAVADLIDNSISAGASTVQVGFHWTGAESVVAIFDDGHGMDGSALEAAMTLGSRNPLEVRGEHDLGRFGLGLKTASLSQCARLLVASKVALGKTEVRVWDLSLVTTENQWIVIDEPNASEAAFVEQLSARPSGTLVLWSHLDRLVGAVSADDEAARLHFQRMAADVESHLSLTFHRYLEGRVPRLRLYINGSSEEHRVKSWDPFCSTHPATQHLGEARRQAAAGTVSIQGFVLPHKDRFATPEDFDDAGGPAGWAQQQGFYVYRNERLLVPGSWLGLGRPRRWNKDEQHKLARIRLDLPNSSDGEWHIDVKKSKAAPPFELRDWLTRNAERIRHEAREVFVHRGAYTTARSRAEYCPVWFSDAGSSTRYRINREHPAIMGILASSAPKGQVETAIRLLETTVPIHRIWLDVSERPEVPPQPKQQLPAEEVLRMANDLLKRLMSGHSISHQVALARLSQLEPFDQFPEVLSALVQT